MYRYITILILGLLSQGCWNQQNISKQPEPVGTFLEPEKVETSIEEESFQVPEKSVVFFTPKAHELEELTLDQTARESLHQAIGDFAYYASIVTDSLALKHIPVLFTNSFLMNFRAGAESYSVDRRIDGALMGLILFNGVDQPKVLPGMQTHISLLAAVRDYFFEEEEHLIPLLDYFEEIETRSIHVYSSHGDILNQTGNRIHPSFYPKFGQHIANKANKYHMSVYAYNKFPLPDSLSAIICRVPSRYDESAIRLYIWDSQMSMVLDEIELAENVWNEKWIMVKDSWLTIEPGTGKFSFIQRKKEARMKNGVRKVADSLYRWQWTGKAFIQLPTTNLVTKNYPLKDWESYKEPSVKEPSIPTEITIVDEDYVWLPLETGDLTWENVILTLPKPFSIQKEPIENQLVKNQIDTLITLSQPNVKLKFYRSPVDNLVVNGVISDDSFSFKKGLKVGVDKRAFATVFGELKSHTALPDLVNISSKNQDRIISYHFHNDTLVRIEFTNYIH